MSEGPILHLYKYGRKTELHTDACKQGYGAILLQEAEDGKLHPVYYMSKKTNTAEEKYDSYELEVLAIINALKKFRVYLLGQPFKIVTDCSAFQKTMQNKELITLIARWALHLEEFDYEIEHRSGSRMKHVDALSRYPVMMVCNDTLTSNLKNAQEEDDNIQTLKSLLEKQESEEFFERNGILYKYLNGRELIVTPKAMQAELIKLIHENGHFSVGKTEEIVKQEFFIPNLSNVVKKESIPLSTYHVDFIGPLPSTNKSYQHIFTVVDAFTKFTWLYPVKTVSAESALEKLKQQQKTFGNPIRIISDRGSAFTSKLFNDYCDEENIQHLQIATGVPRGNGQVERIHRTLIPVLTKLSLDDSTKCDEAHFWLNGYVNKQNCRIWSEANPQVYVETPLHPEKLTVWYALWAGGIIGPYFFKNDEGHNVTVNGDRYRAMITNFFISELSNHDVQELWFQQDGSTCHTARATIDLLKDTFGDRLISRFGPVNWPPRSCDLTPLDYFL
ncbi:transposon Tf2-11 polyprotein [Trichonephila clavipes]|nr:transposon Tf2-11 polyprotein [Trichonephila clavipes]